MNKKKTIPKDFLLRISDKSNYSSLEKIAKEKRWSVNTLLNSMIDDYIKEYETRLQTNIKNA